MLKQQLVLARRKIAAAADDPRGRSADRSGDRSLCPADGEFPLRA